MKDNNQHLGVWLGFSVAVPSFSTVSNSFIQRDIICNSMVTKYRTGNFILTFTQQTFANKSGKTA